MTTLSLAEFDKDLARLEQQCLESAGAFRTAYGRPSPNQAALARGVLLARVLLRDALSPFYRERYPEPTFEETCKATKTEEFPPLHA